MKRIIIFLCLVFAFSSLTYAKNKQNDAPKSKYNVTSPRVYVIDNFEDGSFETTPSWWRFGDVKIRVKDIEYDVPFTQRKALAISGSTSDRVIGGIGRYVGISAKRYNAIKLIIKSNKKENGMLRIELFDDDNNNTEIELNEDNPSFLTYDDKFTYTKNIDWEGWRVVIIPLDRFVDENSLTGDNKWNPYHTDFSGGLIQVQLIFMASEDKGDIDIEIDYMKLYWDKYVYKTRLRKK